MKFEFSAGGIVFKKQGNKTQVLVCQHSQHHGWVFPKGLIGDHVRNEGKDETALREVQEETGVIGKILQEFEPVTYWYVFEKEKIKKTVYYFLMEYVTGDIEEHDDEMEDVEWLDIDEVENRLTYKSDKQVWEKAKKLMTENLKLKT